MATALRLFKVACGSKAIDEYDHDDVRKAKAAVLAEPIKNGTKQKRWNMLSALFSFAKDNRLVSVDVFREIRLELKDDSTERLDWTTEALNKLFATPVWAAGERPVVGGGEAAWWLPVLSLLHGKLSELRACSFRRASHRRASKFSTNAAARELDDTSSMPACLSCIGDTLQLTC
jgi:hypothetical protein